MLPVRLTIQGVNSYQNIQTIDFENLITAKTFGIFGSVGSGKSTIPEAISFALYGKMERLNKSDGVSYNLMNLRSNTLLIDFEFEAENNERYRFVVKGKRNSKNFDDVSLDKSRYKWISGVWMPDENLDAEIILGLSYDNFKRTIIIPQNKFMEFIHLGDADRTRMLKEIFNLEKYDLLGKVKLLENQTELEMSNLNGKLEGLIEINQDSIVERKKEAETIINIKTGLETELISLNKEFLIFNETRTLLEELKKTEEKFNELLISKPKMESLENELKSFRTCHLNFKSSIEEKSKTSHKIDISTNELKELNVSNLKNIEIIKKLKISLEEQRKDHDNIDALKTQSEELGKIASVNKINFALIEAESGLKLNETSLSQIRSDIENTEKTISELRETISAKELEIPDISVLSQIKEWFLQTEFKKNIIAELQNNLKGKNENLLILHDQKSNELRSEELKDLKIPDDPDLNSIIQYLDSKVIMFSEGLKQLSVEKENLAVKLKLREFSSDLTEGKPCPVCGSLSHPHPLKNENVETEINQLLTRINKGEEIIKNIGSKTNTLKSINSDISNQLKNIEDLSNSLKEKQTELSLHLNQFRWQNFSPENKKAVMEEFDNASFKNSEVKKFRAEQEKLIKLKDEKLIEKDSLQKSQYSLKNEIHGLTSQKNTLLNQVKIMNYTDYIKFTVTDIVEKQEKLTNRISEIITQFAHTESELKANEITETAIRTKITETEKTAAQLNREIDQLDKKIKDDLLKYGFSSEAEVISILDKKLDITKTESEINNFKINFEILKSQKEILEKKTVGKKFDLIAFEDTKNKIDFKKTEIEDLQHKLGGLQKTIEDWTAKLIVKIDLTKQLYEKELRLDDLKTMRALFTGSGFVNYISTVRLQELVNYANSRFHRLTRGRLSLVLNQNNSFSIIDYLNDGKKRIVKTLSGGQQFQVSLSLALALAGVVQKQNKSSQNFFFLDEGFGTQDEESLNLVFDTITSLRKENRIVGLISHVTELKEGINAYLEIVNDEKTGSIINKSWEKI